ncbi:unnamed protein product [Ixodes pacificus]
MASSLTHFREYQLGRATFDRAPHVGRQLWQLRSINQPKIQQTVARSIRKKYCVRLRRSMHLCLRVYRSFWKLRRPQCYSTTLLLACECLHYYFNNNERFVMMSGGFFIYYFARVLGG